MAIIISGKELSAQKRAYMTEQTKELKVKYGRAPHLAVILVGEDPGSVSYVTGKEKACIECGLTNTTIKKPTTITENELLDIINDLNNNDEIDGILVQLPLPKHINSDVVINAINPEKDVDGFHPVNVAGLYLKQKAVLPCTPKGIIQLLESANIEIAGKKACVIGRSNIVGMPVSKLLLDKNASVAIVHSRSKNIAEITSQADILIAAVGKPLFVTSDMVKEGAVVIDVGVNRNLETGKLCGDVDYANVKEKASYITKVPGGVGPMTITCLIENTIECFLSHMNK
ncbi:MAG: bifunctional methylenetetrahydrofolate dehydrogenase/methenyltetrahydrofolate cyclohydrolase FolD [Acholeplasmatales bacterium]|nr:bifunctional methylenetetrahydrofolate dehydrogenase/methenyltetrahydrofolate cyclohydrolase FolD [Acholeplasmatales bacterium]